LPIAALVTTIAAALTLRRAITPWSSLPDSDYWGNISGIVTETGVRLGLDTSPKAMPVCALALFAGENELAPLDSCQTAGASAATR
jgi:hypothetical protein